MSKHVLATILFAAKPASILMMTLGGFARSMEKGRNRAEVFRITSNYLPVWWMLFSLHTRLCVLDAFLSSHSPLLTASLSAPSIVQEFKNQISSELAQRCLIPQRVAQTTQLTVTIPVSPLFVPSIPCAADLVYRVECCRCHRTASEELDLLIKRCNVLRANKAS
jgi:hypothetical protein